MSEMGAALGLAQLQRIEELLTKRARVAQWYDERLVECGQRLSVVLSLIGITIPGQANQNGVYTRCLTITMSALI